MFRLLFLFFSEKNYVDSNFEFESIFHLFFLLGFFLMTDILYTGCSVLIL